VFQCRFRFNTYSCLADRLGGAPSVALASSSSAGPDRQRRRGVDARTPRLDRRTHASLVLATAGLPGTRGVARFRRCGCWRRALPLGLLAVGAGLTFNATVTQWFHAVSSWRAGIALMWHARWRSPLELQVAMTQAAVPTATSAYILAARMNGRGAPVAVIVTTGTLLAALTLPLWLGLVAP
jgi:hypothetical protein